MQSKARSDAAIQSVAKSLQSQEGACSDAAIQTVAKSLQSQEGNMEEEEREAEGKG
jgi:hypothetical protein